jgi:serine/threonine-protein kinase RsbW
MTPDMELALSARAENIAIVRHALGGFGEAFAVPESKEGPMEILAGMHEGELTVLVRDWGEGIRPRSDSPGLGLGLSLIAALAETVQLGRDDAEHTEVRMTFALEDAMSLTEAVPSMNGQPA